MRLYMPEMVRKSYRNRMASQGKALKTLIKKCDKVLYKYSDLVSRKYRYIFISLL
jgi:hypothetical protein